jgi:serine/threonine-protein kinase
MPIEPGQTLLHYRLDEKIGEGGMGVVWKATDTSLNRQAAIKVLPEAFASDPDRVGRFEREARFVASLSHPNVAGIYGTHEASGCRFLAMEFVEGEDLAQLLSRGTIPRDEALEIAVQIARGLEAAHDSGVIHRDLKPANVKRTPDGSIKVLDFGLAKVFLPESSAGGEPSMSPTLTSGGTMAGVILGTASYMSPEQAKGKEVDRRADIWSFGVVLFELLTGRSPFQCESVPETLAAVMMREVDLGALPADTPGQVKRLLRRCLQRDPQKRLRDIGDARLLLEEAQQAPETEAPLETVVPARARWLARAPWAVAAAAVAVAVWLGLSSPAAPESTTMRFSLSLQDGLQVGNFFSMAALDVSPDGQRVVMEARNEDGNGLYLREMGREEAELLDGTEGAQTPIFSPDGQWIAFAHLRLRRPAGNALRRPGPARRELGQRGPDRPRSGPRLRAHARAGVRRRARSFDRARARRESQRHAVPPLAGVSSRREDGAVHQDAQRQRLRDRRHRRGIGGRRRAEGPGQGRDLPAVRAGRLSGLPAAEHAVRGALLCRAG